MRRSMTLSALLVLALGATVRSQELSSEQSQRIARARQVQSQQAERAARQSSQSSQVAQQQATQEAARTRRVAAARSAQQPRVVASEAPKQQLSPMDVALRRKLANQCRMAKDWLAQNSQRPGAESMLRHQMQKQRVAAVAMLRRSSGVPASNVAPNAASRRAAASSVPAAKPGSSQAPGRPRSR